MTDVKVTNAKKTLQMANVGKYFRHTYLTLFSVTTFKINLCVRALLSNAHVSSIHGTVTKKEHYVNICVAFKCLVLLVSVTMNTGGRKKLMKLIENLEVTKLFQFPWGNEQRLWYT